MAPGRELLRLVELCYTECRLIHNNILDLIGSLRDNEGFL